MVGEYGIGLPMKSICAVRRNQDCWADDKHAAIISNCVIVRAKGSASAAALGVMVCSRPLPWASLRLLLTARVTPPIVSPFLKGAAGKERAAASEAHRLAIRLALWACRNGQRRCVDGQRRVGESDCVKLGCRPVPEALLNVTV